MDEVKSTLTVYFDEPFWVGVYERTSAGKMQAAKITFGAEPKDYEVYSFLLTNIYTLDFGPAVPAGKAIQTQINPKRMQRAVNNQMHTKGVGTKAQEALKLQHEQKKKESIATKRESTEKGEEQRFALRQVKKKEKHRGH
jgi:Protein of unknown function (DUF2992).